MYVFSLAIKRLISGPANSLLSLVLFAIGCSIISLIILTDRQVKSNVEKNLAGVDLVVGAKGSPMQLILSTLLHADYPTGNISLEEASRMARNPLVEKSIPMALGDSYRGYRIVGVPLAYPQLYNATLANGRWYDNTLEATVGYNVARTTGLQIGDRFYGVHGFQETGHSHPEFLYTVTGIMEKGAGIIDNLILTPVESVWKVHEGHHHDTAHDDHDDTHHHDHENCDHDHSHHEHDHAHNDHADPRIADIQQRVEAGEDISREEMELFTAYMQGEEIPSTDDRQITAMLLVFRSPAGHIQLPRLINESTQMQAASPALELNRLFGLLSFGMDALMILAWVIMIISGLNIFIHLWNTLRQDLYEIALMRVMGAGPDNVFLLLMLQGLLLAAGGWTLGILLSRGVWLLLPSYHFLPQTLFAGLQARELALLGYALLTGALAAIIPAWSAYKTDVHFTLTQSRNV